MCPKFACPFFSTRDVVVLPCPTPVLTIGFPRVGAPGGDTVTLANGAVVDLSELGRIVSQFCLAQDDTANTVFM